MTVAIVVYKGLIPVVGRILTLIVAKLSTEQLNTHLAAFNDLKVGKMSITDFECFSNKLMYDVYKLTSDEIQYIENQQIV